MFCPTVTVNLVQPYIILTFCPPLQLRYIHRKVFFCVQLVSSDAQDRRTCQQCDEGTCLSKSLLKLLPWSSKIKCVGLHYRNTRTLFNIDVCTVFVNVSCYYYWWQCVNVWLRAAKSVTYRAACKRKRCQSWHGATSNCLPKPSRVNSPDSFRDKSVL